MSTDVIINLLQIILLTLTCIVVMVVAAFKRDHALANALSIGGLVISLLVYWFVSPILPLAATPLLMIDQFSLFFSSLIIIGAIVVCFFAYPYFEGHGSLNEEFYILLLAATLGAVVLASSNHFVSFFLGMEILSVSLYAMIAYPVHARVSAKFPLEAGIKYLILSGLGSAIMLFGIALVYAQLGTLAFSEFAMALMRTVINGNLVFTIGLLMIIAGVAFKLSLVPFHMWTPDVYEGAPMPVTAYIATVSKAAMLAVTLRLLLATSALYNPVVVAVFSILAAASMLIGNLLAVRQNNVKRILAYSSIAHLGYLLVVVIAAQIIDMQTAVEASGFYMVAYVLTSLGAFGVAGALSNSDHELDDISDYQGLVWRNPLLAAVMITMLLSLAGIPLTSGFIGKFYLFVGAVEADLWGLLSFLVIGSGIGLYYYLRLVYTMLQSPAEGQEGAATGISLGNYVVLTLLALAVIYYGVLPSSLIDSLQSLAAAL